MADWEPPESFDGFELKGVLGRGGMGRVYLAYEVTLDRPVALKLIAADNPDQSARLRFAREARAIARLQHPNIVAIYRVGEVEGRPYIAYEYVDGESLDRVPMPVPWTRAAEIGLAIARGLGLAHQRGVLHRDVKPANVILARDGPVKLVDFGLAKLFVEPVFETRTETDKSRWAEELGTADTTRLASGIRDWRTDASTWHGPERTGAMIGTPGYVAPELWLGERSSARSDVYALGLVLYEICTGKRPFAGLSGAELVERVTTASLPPLSTEVVDIPRSFAAVVDKAASREPSHRYANGGEVAAALETVESVLRGFRTVAADARPDDASLVAASLSRVQGDADVLMNAFYDRLFARTPALRRLFPASMLDQKMMLAAALRLVVDHLRDPDKLVPVLEDLGWRHARYGAGPEHLSLFGDALLDTIREFDRASWNEATEAAWKRAYSAIAEAMRRGMALHAERKLA